MVLFKKTKNKVLTRRQETQLFEHVMQEIKRDERNEGIWGQALVSSQGDADKARAIYIQLRVDYLKDEIFLDQILHDEIFEAFQKEQADIEFQAAAELEEAQIPTIQLENEQKKRNEELSRNDSKAFLWFFVIPAVVGILAIAFTIL